jgi:hypothetical protein
MPPATLDAFVVQMMREVKFDENSCLGGCPWFWFVVPGSVLGLTQALSKEKAGKQSPAGPSHFNGIPS